MHAPSSSAPHTPHPANTPPPVNVNVIRRPTSAALSAKTGIETCSYDSVTRDQPLTKRIPAGKGSEDLELTPSQRRRLVDLMRDGMRNSPTVATVTLQHDLNVVGSVGGILQLTTDDKDYNRSAARLFGRWARRCEWTYSESLNDILSNVVRCLDLTGDCILIHDAPSIAGTTDGTVTPSDPIAAPLLGTGKLRLVESDEIVSCSDPNEITRRYGGTADHPVTQSHGLVYDAYGRLVGAVISTACRGKDAAPAENCIFLHRDPAAALQDTSWILIRAAWRPNQGRGISPLAPAAASLSNIETIITSETASVRSAAQTTGIISYDADRLARQQIPEAYRITPVDTAPADQMAAHTATPTTPGAEGRPTLFQQATPAQSPTVDPTPAEVAQTFEVDVRDVEAAKGTKTLLVPSGVKYEEHTSSHPNLDIQAFCRELASSASRLLGMGDQYTTLTPQGSYSAYRGSVVMARPAFERLQKTLERQLLDWIAVRILAQASASGELPLPHGTDLDGLAAALAWKWPRPLEANAVDAENATRLALQTGTITYRDILGPDWEEIIAQRGRERAALAANGLVDPMAQTVSGATLPADPSTP